MDNQERDYAREYVKEIIKEPTDEPEVPEGLARDMFPPEIEEEPAQSQYVTESIKKTRTRVLPGMGKALIFGIIFGLFACLAFYVIRPWASGLFKKEETISLQQDSSDDIIITTPEDNDNDHAKPEPENPDEALMLPDEMQEGKDVELTDENYVQMYDSLKEIADAANHFMVTVTGQGDESGWFEGTYTGPTSASGMIVAETDSEYLIVAPQKILNKATSVRVKFCNGSSYDAEIKAQDGNTHLAVLSVPREVVSDNTALYAEVAPLGNSYNTPVGSQLILMGSPFGVDESTAYGNLSAKSGKSTLEDGSYKLLVSDVGGAYNSSGAMINLKGEVIGIMLPNVAADSYQVVTALPISEVKNVIERLINGEDVPYLGVTGIDVDMATAASLGMEPGICLTAVTMDSPAMEGGLQIGDTLLSINRIEVNSLPMLHTEIMKYKVGETISMVVSRGGEYTTLKVTLGKK